MNYNCKQRHEQFINHSERHNANIREALNNQRKNEKENKENKCIKG